MGLIAVHEKKKKKKIAVHLDFPDANRLRMDYGRNHNHKCALTLSCEGNNSGAKESLIWWNSP